MRILIVSRYVMHPSWHGPAQHVNTFARALIQRGHDVLVVSGEDVEQKSTRNQNGYPLVSVPIQRHGSKLESVTSVDWREPAHFSTARSVFNEWRPDIVHLGVFGQMLPYVEVAREFSIPVVSILHDYSWFCLTKFLINQYHKPCSGPTTNTKCIKCIEYQLSKKRQILARGYRFVKKLPASEYFLPFEKKYIDINATVERSISNLERFRKKIDLFIVQSPNAREFLTNYGIPNHRIAFVGQWLSAEKLKRYPRTSSRKLRHKLRLGFIGRLDVEKGLHILGKALRRIQRFDEFELWILSSNASADRAAKLMEIDLADGLDFQVLGDLQQKEKLPKTLAELDLVIIPSVCIETGPRVLLEAIAQKVPCIASRGMGNSYLIEDHVNGRLFEMGNSYELENILVEILDSPEILEAYMSRLPVVMGESDWFKRIYAVHEQVLALRPPASNVEVQ